MDKVTFFFIRIFLLFPKVIITLINFVFFFLLYSSFNIIYCDDVIFNTLMPNQIHWDSIILQLIQECKIVQLKEYLEQIYQTKKMNPFTLMKVLITIDIEKTENVVNLMHLGMLLKQKFFLTAENIHLTTQMLLKQEIGERKFLLNQICARMLGSSLTFFFEICEKNIDYKPPQSQMVSLISWYANFMSKHVNINSSFYQTNNLFATFPHITKLPSQELCYFIIVCFMTQLALLEIIIFCYFFTGML